MKTQHSQDRKARLESIGLRPVDASYLVNVVNFAAEKYMSKGGFDVLVKTFDETRYDSEGNSGDNLWAVVESGTLITFFLRASHRPPRQRGNKIVKLQTLIG